MRVSGHLRVPLHSAGVLLLEGQPRRTGPVVSLQVAGRLTGGCPSGSNTGRSKRVSTAHTTRTPDRPREIWGGRREGGGSQHV